MVTVSMLSYYENVLDELFPISPDFYDPPFHTGSLVNSVGDSCLRGGWVIEDLARSDNIR